MAAACGIALALTLLASPACRKSESEVRPPQTNPSPAAGARPGHVETQMRNVNLRIMEGVTLQIRNLRGRLVRKAPEGPVIFDDRDSFVLEIDTGEIAIATPDLARLMNGYVFAYPDSPLKKMSFAIVGNELKQEGVIQKGVDIPFTVLGSVSVTPENWIRVHPSKIEAVGIPVKGLMEFFGLELEKLLKLKGHASVKIDGDDFLLDPERLLPPPQIKGRVKAVRLEKDKLIQVFDSGQPAEALQPPITGANYLFFRGSLLRFGKLTMSDADLQIVDADLKDPFDFFQQKYNDQLVAGYSKNTPDGGLIVFMPDFEELSGPRKPSLKPRPSRSARRT
ncbi:MAG TPA: hypothetical protein VIE39_02655 [Thermoanaerobaculia bacterium]